MTLKIDRDRMMLVWSVGNEDLADALLEIEGMEPVRNAKGFADKFRCAEGWERRVVYATVKRATERDRQRERLALRRAS